MIETKEVNKKRLNFKSNKGITMVSLIITIVVLFIVSSISIYTSLDRFEINKLKKMQNDIELLNDKVANYYLKYNGLPILKDNDTNTSVKYSSPLLGLDKNPNDNDIYYILDLAAMEGISLNYGEDFNKTNSSDNVYIINEKSHQIYYVKGIELDGVTYHTIKNNTNVINDNIPPSKPEIKVIFGEQNSNGEYITDVKIEIIPGKDSISGIERTMYSINGGTEKNITTLTNNIYTIKEIGDYEITARSYDYNNNYSEISRKVILKDGLIHNGIIPEGGTYYVGITTNEIGKGYNTATETYTAGEEFPTTVSKGDRYVYKQYEYCFGMKSDPSKWVEESNESKTWGVALYKTNDSIYKKTLKSINGYNVDVKLMTWTFYGASNLEELYYSGTKDDFKDSIASSDWYNLEIENKETRTIHCIDGDIIYDLGDLQENNYRYYAERK